MNKFGKLLATSAVFACVAATSAQAADVVIGVPNWPSVRITANVLKVVMEEDLGLEVELQNGTNPVIFEAMDTGSMHVHPEVWLPNQVNLHDKFVKEKGTVKMTPAAVAASQGICVTKGSVERTGIVNLSDTIIGRDSYLDPENIYKIARMKRPLVQVGVVNGSQQSFTTQFGLVNYSEDEFCVQFGLININKANRKGFRVIPFVNFHIKDAEGKELKQQLKEENKKIKAQEKKDRKELREAQKEFKKIEKELYKSQKQE